jgi:glutamate dehydrogenase/leucine dehydrogenase
MNGNKPAQSTNILILGLGGIGYYLAKRLVHEGYAITTIESEREVIRHADGVLDARLMGMTGVEQQKRHRVMVLGGDLVGRRPGRAL